MADVKPPAGKPAGKPGGKPGGGKPPPPPPPTGKPGAILVEILIAVLVFLLIIPFFRLSSLAGDSVNPISSILSSIISFVTLISTVVSMVAIVIVIFSFVRIHELAAEESKKLGLTLSWENERTQKNERWKRVEEYMTSLNSSDWKVGILEADNILDEVVERMGYQGSTLGERMKKISATDFPYLEEAWEAHKIRNAVAHKGTDYALSRSDAEHIINIYYRIFSSLGYL